MTAQWTTPKQHAPAKLTQANLRMVSNTSNAHGMLISRRLSTTVCCRNAPRPSIRHVWRRWWLHTSATVFMLRLSRPSVWYCPTKQFARQLAIVLAQPYANHHICVCRAIVDARGLHGLACRKSAPRHVCYSQLNDLVCRAVKKPQKPANKEQIGLSRADGKRPYGATLVPSTRGKQLP